jgi:hypothetical protein
MACQRHFQPGRSGWLNLGLPNHVRDRGRHGGPVADGAGIPAVGAGRVASAEPEVARGGLQNRQLAEAALLDPTDAYVA